MKKWIVILSIIFPATSFAMFCPNNFNQIDIGYTIDQVTELCGKPDTEKKVKAPPSTKNEPQEWNYYLNPTKGSNRLTPAPVGNLKTALAFDKGKLVNISVNGTSLLTTTICGAAISVGDDQDKVKSACGDPSFINLDSQSQARQAKLPEVETTTWTYSGSSDTQLIFENGKLKERK